MSEAPHSPNLSTCLLYFLAREYTFSTFHLASLWTLTDGHAIWFHALVTFNNSLGWPRGGKNVQTIAIEWDSILATPFQLRVKIFFTFPYYPHFTFYLWPNFQLWCASSSYLAIGEVALWPTGCSLNEICIYWFLKFDRYLKTLVKIDWSREWLVFWNLIRIFNLMTKIP